MFFERVLHYGLGIFFFEFFRVGFVSRVCNKSGELTACHVVYSHPKLPADLHLVLGVVEIQSDVPPVNVTLFKKRDFFIHCLPTAHYELSGGNQHELDARAVRDHLPCQLLLQFPWRLGLIK